MEEESNGLNGWFKQAEGKGHPDTSCHEIAHQHGNGDVHNIIAKGLLKHTLVVVNELLNMSHG